MKVGVTPSHSGLARRGLVPSAAGQCASVLKQHQGGRLHAVWVLTGMQHVHLDTPDIGRKTAGGSFPRDPAKHRIQAASATQVPHPARLLFSSLLSSPPLLIPRRTNDPSPDLLPPARHAPSLLHRAVPHTLLLRVHCRPEVMCSGGHRGSSFLLRTISLPTLIYQASSRDLWRPTNPPSPLLQPLAPTSSSTRTRLLDWLLDTTLQELEHHFTLFPRSLDHHLRHGRR